MSLKNKIRNVRDALSPTLEQEQASRFIAARTRAEIKSPNTPVARKRELRRNVVEAAARESDKAADAVVVELYGTGPAAQELMTQDYNSAKVTKTGKLFCWVLGLALVTTGVLYGSASKVVAGAALAIGGPELLDHREEIRASIQGTYVRAVEYMGPTEEENKAELKALIDNGALDVA